MSAIFCAGPGACLLWNYEEVLSLCRDAGNVVATFSGHAHQVTCLPCCLTQRSYLCPPDFMNEVRMVSMSEVRMR